MKHSHPTAPKEAEMTNKQSQKQTLDMNPPKYEQ